MNVKVLIDAIVRQTTVLIAQLATSAGIRAPLAHIANQVFLELVAELESQGVGRKVIADMFGLALRSYQLKVRRLSESSTVKDRSLWEAVYEYLRTSDRVVTRADVLLRFVHDDESVVRSVLHDLVESGLLFKTGRGPATAYRVARDDEFDDGGIPEEQRTQALTWVFVYRHQPISEPDLLDKTGLDTDGLQEALDALIDEGRIEREATDDGWVYRSATCVIPLGSPVGFEAGLFDHYQALVAAMCTKLDAGRRSSLPNDVIGGSTYSFDVWPGHPHADEIYGVLGRVRDEVGVLWDEVSAYNQANRDPGQEYTKVTFYCGQNVRLGELDTDEGAEP